MNHGLALGVDHECVGRAPDVVEEQLLELLQRQRRRDHAEELLLGGALVGVDRLGERCDHSAPGEVDVRRRPDLAAAPGLLADERQPRLHDLVVGRSVVFDPGLVEAAAGCRQARESVMRTPSFLVALPPFGTYPERKHVLAVIPKHRRRQVSRVPVIVIVILLLWRHPAPANILWYAVVTTAVPVAGGPSPRDHPAISWCVVAPAVADDHHELLAAGALALVGAQQVGGHLQALREARATVPLQRIDLVAQIDSHGRRGREQLVRHAAELRTFRVNIVVPVVSEGAFGLDDRDVVLDRERLEDGLSDALGAAHAGPFVHRE